MPHCETNDIAVDNSLAPTVLVLTVEVAKDSVENHVQHMVPLSRKMHRCRQVCM